MADWNMYNDWNNIQFGTGTKEDLTAQTEQEKALQLLQQIDTQNRLAQEAKWQEQVRTMQKAWDTIYGNGQQRGILEPLVNMGNPEVLRNIQQEDTASKENLANRTFDLRRKQLEDFYNTDMRNKAEVDSTNRMNLEELMKFQAKMWAMGNKNYPLNYTPQAYPLSLAEMYPKLMTKEIDEKGIYNTLENQDLINRKAKLSMAENIEKYLPSQMGKSNANPNASTNNVILRSLLGGNKQGITSSTSTTSYQTPMDALNEASNSAMHNMQSVFPGQVTMTMNSDGARSFSFSSRTLRDSDKNSIKSNGITNLVGSLISSKDINMTQGLRNKLQEIYTQNSADEKIKLSKELYDKVSKDNQFSEIDKTIALRVYDLSKWQGEPLSTYTVNKQKNTITERK